MTAAIFGLIGVVVGAVVTGVVEWMLDRRRAANERRAALRLLLGDLHVAVALIRPVLETTRWGIEETLIPTEGWSEHHGTLAAEVRDRRAWRHIQGSILGIRRLNDARSQCLRDERDFSDAELADFRRIGRYIEETIELVEPYGA